MVYGLEGGLHCTALHCTKAVHPKSVLHARYLFMACEHKWVPKNNQARQLDQAVIGVHLRLLICS